MHVPVRLFDRELAGANGEEIRAACRFFVTEALLSDNASHYQELGLPMDAAKSAIRNHYQWLMQIFSEEMDVSFGKLREQKYEFKTYIPLSVKQEKVKSLRNSSETKITEDLMNLITERITDLPENFHLHPKLKKFIE